MIDNELDNTPAPTTTVPETEVRPPQPQLSQEDLALLKDVGVDVDDADVDGEADGDAESAEGDDDFLKATDKGVEKEAGDEEVTRQDPDERAADTPDDPSGYEIEAAGDLPESNEAL